MSRETNFINILNKKNIHKSISSLDNKISSVGNRIKFTIRPDKMSPENIIFDKQDIYTFFKIFQKYSNKEMYEKYFQKNIKKINENSTIIYFSQYSNKFDLVILIKSIVNHMIGRIYTFIQNYEDINLHHFNLHHFNSIINILTFKIPLQFKKEMFGIISNNPYIYKLIFGFLVYSNKNDLVLINLTKIINYIKNKNISSFSNNIKVNNINRNLNTYVNTYIN